MNNTRSLLSTYYILFMVVAIFSLGWLGHMLYASYQQEQRIVSGLRFEADNNHPRAIDKAKNYDSNGHWICVNIKGMTYEDALTTCRHETAHEIFSMYCEQPNNIDKCINMTR